MRRSRVALSDIAELANLVWAFWRAARGRREQTEVRAFAERLHAELALLRQGILDLSVPVGVFRTFEVWDPKRRSIHAPCFRERVLHHALMAQVGPVLDRSLVADTFACRRAKGTLAAVRRARQHAGRYPWVVKSDVRRYFDSVDHATLLRLLARRLKDAGVLALLHRVIDSYHTAPGKGLPIGALTSQHFANAYLAPLDRFLLEELRVPGMVRYMDDTVWWCESREQARSSLRAVRVFAAERLSLEIKASARIQRSAHGVDVCGFRVLPGRLRLTRRRKRRYASARRRWERRFRRGEIDVLALQRGCASALGIVSHIDARGFLREDLRRRPALEA